MILFILVILGTLFQSPAMLRSGWLYNYGIGFWGPVARDGVWHLALIEQLKNKIPPTNPGLSGVQLSNYHYFYDLLIAELSQFLHIPASILLFQVFPLIFSILFGIGTYMLAQKLFENKKVSMLAVFFAYFGSSFGWIVSLFKHQPLAGESAFWASQPVSMNINPPFALSLIILIFLSILLDKYFKKPSYYLGVVLILLFGTLIGFKAYAGIIAIVALILLTIKKIFVDKNFSVLPVTIGSVLVFGALYFMVSRNAHGLVIFKPFWLLDNMIDASDRVGISILSAKRFAYQYDGRWYLYLIIEVASLFIFLVGNLGTRVIGLFGLKKVFLKDDLHQFILLLSIVSLAPVFVFVQKGNPWNIVQFFYYFIFFAGLYAASFAAKLPTTILVLILLITPISSLATFRSLLYPNPVSFLSNDEYRALNFLKTLSPGTVLKHPFNANIKSNFSDPYPLAVYADNSYVSAYGTHPVYLEDEEQQIILNTDYKERLKYVNNFFISLNPQKSAEFLKTNHIKYIYLPKIYNLPMIQSNYPIKNIFENKEVVIYGVIDQ